MKKYLLGLFAIVLAVGFSAFTAKKATPHKATTTYFWYEIDQDGKVSSAALNPSEVDRAAAKSLSSGCEEDVSEVCLAGFETDDVSIGTSYVDLSDNLIFKF